MTHTKINLPAGIPLAQIPRMPTQLLLRRAFSHTLLPANSLLRYAASSSPRCHLTISLLLLLFQRTALAKTGSVDLRVSERGRKRVLTPEDSERIAKAIDSQRSIQTNRGQNGRRFWCVQRRTIYHPPASFSSAIPSGHIDIDSTFIQENQTGSPCCLRKPTPLFSLGPHIGDAPVLKRGSSSFFSDTPWPGFSGVPFLFQLAAPISLRFLKV